MAINFIPLFLFSTLTAGLHHNVFSIAKADPKQVIFTECFSASQGTIVKVR